MASELIERAIEYVREKLENEFSGHDYFHTLRVYKTATHIAREENAEVETVQLAALLHDVDDRKISPDFSPFGVSGVVLMNIPEHP